MDIKNYLDIEKKYDLYHANIHGVHYWMYSRYNIWTDTICTATMETAPIYKKNKLTLKGIVNIVQSFFQLTFRRKKSEICFIAHERRLKQDNFYKCIYTEKLSKLFPSAITLERPYENSHLTPVENHNLIYIDYLLFLSSIHYYWHYMWNTHQYRKTLEQVKRQMEAPMRELSETYGCSIDLNKLYKKLVRKYFICAEQEKQCEKLINALQPKVIIEVVSYASLNMVINKIASRKNIPTMELQHGAMHSMHAGYQYESETPIQELPDYLLIFSDFWKNFIKIPIPEKNIITVGYPYFDDMRKQYSGHKRPSDKTTILFISQPTIGKQLSLLASELSAELDMKHYRILYKLHPAEYSSWENEYEPLHHSAIEVIGSNDYHIYQCFAESDIQVGVYSTAIYEGLGFGLDTYIYDIYADTMKQLVEDGYATYVQDVHELKDCIVKEHPQGNYGSNIFWKEHALENIQNVIKETIQ